MNLSPTRFNGKGTGNDYFGFVLNNAVHAQDMIIFDDSSDDVKRAFNQSLHIFSSALQSWLENFHPAIQAGEYLLIDI
jgi:hypothetical protein